MIISLSQPQHSNYYVIMNDRCYFVIGACDGFVIGKQKKKRKMQNATDHHIQQGQKSLD